MPPSTNTPPRMAVFVAVGVDVRAAPALEPVGPEAPESHRGAPAPVLAADPVRPTVVDTDPAAVAP